MTPKERTITETMTDLPGPIAKSDVGDLLCALIRPAAQRLMDINGSACAVPGMTSTVQTGRTSATATGRDSGCYPYDITPRRRLVSARCRQEAFPSGPA